MKKMISLLILLSAYSNLNFAAELTDASVKGIYYLGTPERGNSQVNLGYGQMGNKTVIAVAPCKQCPPAVYSYLPEESDTLGTAIFTTAGLYLIQFDSDSFVIVQPDAILGRQVWSKIGHANIYSKNANIAKSTSRQSIESFAIGLSSKIMNQEIGKMSHGAGTYHLAMPQTHSGKAYSQYQIEFMTEGKKQINITPCEKCGVDEYIHLPDESAIAGVDVYRHATSYYLFDLKDGVLIYTFANAGGLGKDLWGKNSHYNVYSNNQAYIRQILVSKEKQDTIDEMMTAYFKEIKTEFERRVKEEQLEKTANRKLPTEGYKNAEEKQKALTAANRWVNAWKWDESLKDAYFVASDWSITRNRLTGIITGKIISGVVTMTHPDGRCRFQYMTFRQDYDGNDYTNLHSTGIGPIYDLKCDQI